MPTNYNYNYAQTATNSSPDLMLYVYLVIFLLFSFFAIVLFYQLYKQYSYEKTKIARSLNMVLLKVLVPKGNMKEGEESKKGVKEFAARASQMLSSLYSIKDQKVLGFNYDKGLYISFEIVSHEEKIAFYVSFPRQIQTLIEKQIYGFYPDAYLEEVDRYNIFEENNQFAAAEMVLADDLLLPIKTYKEFEEDTCNVLTSSLSKLGEGEGAAIQFILRPAKFKWQKNSEYVIKKLQEGKSIKEGVSLSKIGKGALKLSGEVASQMTTFSDPNKSSDSSKPKTATPLGEQQIKLIGEKISFVGFETVIRIVTSCPEKSNAKMHLANIMASFIGFGHAVGNRFVKNKKSGREERIVENFIFRHFPFNYQKTVLNVEELATIFHFPNRMVETPNIEWFTSRLAPVPPEVPKEGLYLGKNIYRGVKTPVFMKEKDRLRHMYVIGKTGSGKTTIMKEMIMQDIARGEGVCYIDPHGTDVEEILSRIPKERADDVIYFNPIDLERPMGLNLLEYNPQKPLEKTLVVNEVIGVFDFLYNLKETGGPMFEQYFRNAALLVMESPESGSTMLEIPKVLADEDFRAYKLSKCNNPVVKNYWVKEAEKAGGDAALANVVPYVSSKMTQFLANDLMRPIIAQQNSAFNFREIMDSKKILLVNLSKGQIGEMNMKLLGLILVGKMFVATMSRADSPNMHELPPFYMYIDEFQNFASDSIAAILSEARKYKLSLCIAHQFLGQLDRVELVKKAIFGNVGTKLVHRIDVEDAKAFQETFEPTFNSNDLINLGEFECCSSLLVDGINIKPFSMRTFNISDYEPINAYIKANKKVTESIRQLSRLKYGRDRETVEEEIRERA
uniref:Type IV secretory system conjugative DNA transfer family protein n=1 Tax=candidate division CPR3 bacterium TaxID=2268181 RepID=A0A7C4R4V7_UNCC3